MGATDNFFERKREWSRLKDSVLGTYLTPYLTKITRTGKPCLVVDCFAGKGKFDDGEPGSPLIIAGAIQAIHKLRPGSDVRGIFIERKYHKDLREVLEPFDHCEILAGTFEEHIANLETRLPTDSNILLFVDPYGIKSLSMSRFGGVLDLRPSSLEIMMNFTSFGFLREGCRLLSIEGFETENSADVYEDDPDSPNSPERMDAIAGGQYWRDILRDYYDEKLDMRTAERKFSQMYLEHLRVLFPHVVNIPVQYKREQLPKYRLIHGTSSDDGLILMADNMGREWRAFVERESSGQRPLFEAIDYPDMVAMEGYSLEENILALTSSPTMLKDLLVSLLVRFGITFSTGYLCSVIKGMDRPGILHVQRYPSRTPTGRISTSMDYRKYQITVERA